MMKKNLIGLIIIGSMLVGLSQETEIHLAGIFPINGVEGWQGGQVPTVMDIKDWTPHRVIEVKVP